MRRRISVTVKPNSKSPSVAKLSDSEFRASVREPARDGVANQALVELLAGYFGVAKSTVKIVRGHGSRHKVVELG